MQDKASAGPDKSGIVVGILLLVLAGVLWFDAVNLSGAVSYGVGPAVFPKLIAVGLVLLGVLSILSGWRSAAEELEDVNWRAIGLIVGGFLIVTAIIGFGGGFIPAMVLLFVATATAFGRRAYLVDAALGLAIAVSTYLLFAKLLTLSLPRGPLERLIG